MWYVDHNNYSARTDLLCCTEMDVRQPSLHVRICSCIAGPHHCDNHKRYTVSVGETTMSSHRLSHREHIGSGQQSTSKRGSATERDYEEAPNEIPESLFSHSIKAFY